MSGLVEPEGFTRASLRGPPRSAPLFTPHSKGRPTLRQATEGIWRGFGLEIVVRDHFGAWRAVYTVRFTGAVYVLHAFQKKSKHGIATPKEVVERIRLRLAETDRLHRERQN